MEEIKEEKVELEDKTVEKTEKELIEERLILVFGEDCVQHFETGGAIIRFPDIDITDGNFNHNIKDLFVKTSWGYDSAGKVVSFVNGLEGMRTSFTDGEIYSRYMHSHLPTMHCNTDNEDFNHEEDDKKLFIEWNGFCLGDDSVAKTLGGLNMGFTMDKFFILLNLIDEFVRWESSDGGPYIRIKKLTRADTSYHEVSISSQVSYLKEIVIKHFYMIMPEIKDLGALDFFTDQRDFNFLDKKAAMDKIGEVLLLKPLLGVLMGTNIPKAMLLNDKYYQKDLGSSEVFDFCEDLEFEGSVSFKGETIYPEIISVASERTDLTKEIDAKGVEVVHPYVTYHILMNLESKLYETLNKKKEWKLIKR